MQIMDNGVLRDATEKEVEEINARALEKPALADAIPMLNLQLVLIEDGKLAPAENAILNMPGVEGQRARAYWARAQTARLDNAVVGLLWPQLYENEEAFLDAWRRAAAMNP